MTEALELEQERILPPLQRVSRAGQLRPYGTVSDIPETVALMSQNQLN
jgi:hypothetical protein